MGWAGQRGSRSVGRTPVDPALWHKFHRCSTTSTQEMQSPATKPMKGCSHGPRGQLRKAEVEGIPQMARPYHTPLMQATSTRDS